jgi:small GTP-binding protein
MDCKKIKICLIGDKGVGKTLLAELLCNYKINHSYSPTVGVGFFCKDINYKNDNIRINFWDTSGDERYFSLVPLYFRLCDVVLLVLDNSNKKSIENCFNWLTLVFHHNENIKVKIIINIVDTKFNFDLNKIIEYCNINKNVSFYYISILKNENIAEFFDNLIKDLYPILQMNYQKRVNLLDKYDNTKCTLFNKNCII